MVAAVCSAALVVSTFVAVGPGRSAPAVAAVAVTTTSAGPTLQLDNMATASGADRRQYVFALADDKRIWASEQLAAGGSGWSDWYAVIGGAFCQAPVTIVNSQNQIEVYGVGCDMAVWRAVQVGSGPGGWSGWHVAGSCCIASKVALVLDGANRINVFGRGTDGAIYTVRQTAAGSNSFTGWGGLGGYLTSTPIAGVDIYGHPYVYALGGDKNVYFQGQESIGGPSFGSWLGWYGVGGGPFIGELGLLVGVVGRRADGKFYVAQKTGRVEHTGWQQLGDGTFISDPTNASSVITGWDYILGRPARSVATMFALGTDRQVYVNQACQSGMSCYSYSYWTGWHLAASGTFLTTPIADWSPDFRRLQMVGMGMQRQVYVNAQVQQLNLGAWTGWTLKPGNGIRTDCTLSWPSGKVFYPREFYRGCNNELFTFQENGQVALYAPDGALKWATPAAGAAASLTIHGDGNMVLYSALSQQNVWVSNSFTAAPKLSLGRDGNLVMFNGQGGYPVWWSNRAKCANYEWPAGTVFEPGDYYVNCSGDMLTMRQSDGNVFQVNNLGETIWATNAAAPGGRMTFQGDGNLVVTNSVGTPVWATATSAPGGTLEFSFAGNLMVNASGGTPVYAQQSQSQSDRDRIRTKIRDAKQKLAEACQAGEFGTTGNPKVRCGNDLQGTSGALFDYLDGIEQALDSYQPGQPCASSTDIVKAILGLTAASGTMAGAVTATKALIVRVIGAIAAIVLAVWSLTDIMQRCADWRHLRDWMRNHDEKIGLLPIPLGPTGTQFSYANSSIAGLPNGQVTSIMSDAFVVEHPEWRVDFGQDPQTPGNTVVGELETTRDGVSGTLYTVGNGDTMFMPRGPVDMSIIYERDNSTGRSVQTLFDNEGHYVITIDSERGLVNVNDGWGGNNPFSAANGGWGWGMTGFGGWTAWAGGGGGGGGGGSDGCFVCMMLY
jgi:hypothetical protein